MKYLIIFKIIQRNIGHTSRAISGMAFTIAIVISLLSLISGLSIQVSSLIFQSGSAGSIIVETQNGTLFSPSVISNKSIANVKAIIPENETQAQVYWQKEQFSLMMVSMNLSLYTQTHPNSYISEGRVPQNFSELAIGSNLANVLNISIGSTLTVNNNNLSVVGIYYDGYGLLNSLFSYETNLTRVSEVEVVLSNPQNGETTFQYIQSLLGENYSLNYTRENKELLTTVINEMLTKFYFVILIIGLMSSIRIYFYMVWIFIHHLNDLLILRVVGFTKQQLFLAGILLGVLIGNSAIFIGIFMGISFPLLFSGIISAVFNIRYVAFFPPTEFLISAGIILNFCLFLGVIKPIRELINSPIIVQQFSGN